MSNKKELNDLMRIVVRLGWVITPTKNCHYKWVAPDGQFFYTSSTPSDTRALERIRKDLRRCGVVIRKK
jgi:hypothetical protein